MKANPALIHACVYIGLAAAGLRAATRAPEFGPTLMAGYSHASLFDPSGESWTWGNNNYGQLGFGYTGSNMPTPHINYVEYSGSVRQGAASGRSEHNLLILSDGQMIAWGRNDYGQLGTGDNVTLDAPANVGNRGDWRALATGRYHSLGIKVDGTLWAWGRNQAGQLGDGSKINRNVPVPITSAGNDWVAVSAGEDFSLGLKVDGSLYAWGNGANGRLGGGNTTSRTVPTKMPSNSSFSNSGFVRIAAGYSSGLALKSDGSLWSWGANSNGQLGRTVTADATAPGHIGSAHWRAIAIGGSFCHAVQDNGYLYGWGKNDQGQVGDKTTTVRPAPVPITAAGNNWLTVSDGDKFGVAMKADGTVYTWGNNVAGQLGNGRFTNSTYPHLIDPATCWGYHGVRPGMLSAGRYHGLAVKSDGTLWAWGFNEFGRTGIAGASLTDIVTTPTALGTPTTSYWISVSSSPNHNLAVKADGTLWGWGANYDGQLAENTSTSQRLIPTQITAAGGGWEAVAANGRGTSFGLKTNGTLYTWGWNGWGASANGSIVSGFALKQVGVGKKWISISCGDDHALALTDDGELWAWGANNNGQIGDNTITNRIAAPVPVGVVPGNLDRHWVSAAAGYQTSSAIRADGTLYSWGSNGVGEQGDDTYTEYHKPSRIPLPVADTYGQSWWSQVSKGYQFSVSVNSLGELNVWGTNMFGQLGLSDFGDVETRPLWIQSGARTVVAGSYFTLFINAYGNVYGAGENDKGQLGDGTINHATSFENLGSILR